MGPAFRAQAFATRKLPVKRAPCLLTRAVASLTFDDFPRSAWTVGGPILARYGARATYYAAGRYLGAEEDGIAYYDAADLRALVDAGHEVGAHSHGHRPAPELSRQALLDDAAATDAALRPHVEARLTSYAYPYGAVSPRTKRLMGGRYACARGITPGVNAGLIELAQLRAVPIESRRWVPAEIDRAVDEAAATAGWLIVFTHDVSEAPSPFGCTPAMLDHVLRRLAGAGVDSLPVRQAMARAVFGEG